MMCRFWRVAVVFCAVSLGCATGVGGEELQDYLENLTLAAANGEAVSQTESLKKPKEVVYSASPEFLSENDVPDQDVWVFHSRTASWVHPSERQLKNISIYRLHRTGEHSRKTFKASWNRSNLDAFCASSNPEIPTIVLIHGNQTSFHEGIESGFHFEQRVLRRKICDASGQTGDNNVLCGVRKYRLLIWCWPADKPAIKISLKDAKLKAFYSEKQAQYVAQVLRRFPPGSHVCMVGFSFGGRTVCEALAQIRQKSRNQNDLVQNTDGNVFIEPTPLHALTVRTLLLAPAVDRTQTVPQCRYGKVLSETDRTMLLYNSRDSALRWYSCIYGCRLEPRSLGREGFPAITHTQAMFGQITAFDIAAMAGKKHSFMVFFLNTALNEKMTRFVFFES